MSNQNKKYRVEGNSVYVYSEDHRAYIHCGKLNGQKLSDFIADYENNQSMNQE